MVETTLETTLAQCELALIFPQAIRCKMPTESYIDISVAEINAFWLWRITTACLGNNEMNICKGYVTGLPWEMNFFYKLKVIKICQRPNS